MCKLIQYLYSMNLKMNYSKHIKNAPNPNQGVGGQDEKVVSEAQLDLLVKNGLRPEHRLLDLGFGTGRLLIRQVSIYGRQALIVELIWLMIWFL